MPFFKRQLRIQTLRHLDSANDPRPKYIVGSSAESVDDTRSEKSDAGISLFVKSKSSNFLKAVKAVSDVRRWIILPKSWSKAFWDFFMSILIVFLSIYTPLIISFRIQFPAQTVIELFVNVVIILDIVFNFFSAYYDDDGALVTDKKLIARRYVTSWFPIDILSSIPTDLLNAGDSDNVSLLLISRVLKILRLFRLLRHAGHASKNGIMRLMERKLQMFPGLTRILRLAFYVAVVAHWFTCLQFYVATLEGYPAESWVRRFGLVESPLSSQYLCTIYWVFTTLSTVGYGDITPGTNGERLMTIFMMLTGATIFAGLVGSVTSLAASLDRRTAVYREKMDNINRFMHYLHLPDSMKARVRAYYEHFLQRSLGFQEAELFGELSPSLRAEIMTYMNKALIEKVPFFQQSNNPRFIRKVVTLLRRNMYAPGDVIVQEGEVGKEMFIISDGRVKIISSDGETVFAVLQSGDYFGEVALLTNIRRTATVVADDFCNIFSLSKDDLHGALEEFPSIMKIFEEEAMKRMQEHEKTRTLALARTSSAFSGVRKAVKQWKSLHERSKAVKRKLERRKRHTRSSRNLHPVSHSFRRRRSVSQNESGANSPHSHTEGVTMGAATIRGASSLFFNAGLSDNDQAYRHEDSLDGHGDDDDDDSKAGLHDRVRPLSLPYNSLYPLTPTSDSGPRNITVSVMESLPASTSVRLKSSMRSSSRKRRPSVHLATSPDVFTSKAPANDEVPLVDLTGAVPKVDSRHARITIGIPEQPATTTVTIPTSFRLKITSNRDDSHSGSVGLAPEVSSAPVTTWVVPVTEPTTSSQPDQDLHLSEGDAPDANSMISTLVVTAHGPSNNLQPGLDHQLPGTPMSATSTTGFLTSPMTKEASVRGRYNSISSPSQRQEVQNDPSNRAPLALQILASSLNRAAALEPSGTQTPTNYASSVFSVLSNRPTPSGSPLSSARVHPAGVLPPYPPPGSNGTSSTPVATHGHAHLNGQMPTTVLTSPSGPFHPYTLNPKATPGPPTPVKTLSASSSIQQTAGQVVPAENHRSPSPLVSRSPSVKFQRGATTQRRQTVADIVGTASQKFLCLRKTGITKKSARLEQQALRAVATEDPSRIENFMLPSDDNDFNCERSDTDMELPNKHDLKVDFAKFELVLHGLRQSLSDEVGECKAGVQQCHQQLTTVHETMSEMMRAILRLEQTVMKQRRPSTNGIYTLRHVLSPSNIEDFAGQDPP